MNNQNSEKENPSPIYFSPTGGDLPPIEIKDRSLGVLIRLLNDTFNALSVFIRGKVKCSEHWVIQVIEEHKENLINIIKNKRTMANTGTMEYNEIQEDMANKTNDMVNHRPCPHCSHSMEYKGEKQHTDGDIYLFHCPKCGAWDEVPKAELDARFYDWMSDINIM